MKNRPWPDALRAQLNRQGLPPKHVRRLMDELADHYSDLMEEKTMNACGTNPETVENRLGKPDELAKAAAANYRGSRFAGRHPWLAFLVAPLPAMVLAWAATMIVAIGLFEAIPSVLGDAYETEGKAISEWPAGLVWAVHAFDFSLRFVVPAAVTVLFCWLVRRSGRRARWALVACGLLAVFASGLQTAWEWPTAGQQGRYTVGFGANLSPHVPEPGYLLQFAVPLAVGIAFTFFWCRRRPPELTCAR
jgi:hypothetical protein